MNRSRTIPARGVQTPASAAVCLLAAALLGCSDVLGTDDVIWMEVAEARVPCVGVGPMECMLVRERPGDDWQAFYSHISGFEYEPGYRYTLTVRRKKVSNPPADGSSLEYRLVRLEDKVPSQRFELLEAARQAQARWLADAPETYVMVQERVCFCTADTRGPVRLAVARVGGPESPIEVVLSRRYVDDDRPVPFQHSDLFLSVWKLFGYIGLAVAREAHIVDVEYDEGLGYPRRVFVDWEEGVADDEFLYIVHSLEAG